MVSRPVHAAGRILLTLTLLLLLPLSLPGAVGAQGPSSPIPSRQELGRIDSIFDHLDNTRSPGCALGAMADGELVLARGYGMADLDHGIAITPERNGDSINGIRVGSRRAGGVLFVRR